LRLHRLDLEVAVALPAALLVRIADPDDALPLAADGEHGGEGGEEAQRGLLEVVLEALEDERRIGAVGLDDRRLQGQALTAAHRRRLRLPGIAGRDVDAGQPRSEAHTSELQ